MGIVADGAFKVVLGVVLALGIGWAGGEVWVVYQAVAPVAFVVLLLTARR